MANAQHIKAARLIAASLFFVFCGLCAAGERITPNIVLIVMDDVGYSDLGSFGGEIETPNIDRLALTGVRFSNFHTASSCAPTRAMLLTGVDHHLAGVGNMVESMPMAHRGQPGYLGVLNDRVETVATRLQGVGYRTVIAGKWHLGHETANLPPARGFDHSLIQADSGSDNFEMRPYLPMNPEVYWYENGTRLMALPDNFYSSTYFVDKTIEFLEADGGSGRPFFSYLAFQANHTPLQAPAHFIDHYRGRYSEGWHAVRSERIRRMIDLGLLEEDAQLAPGPSQTQWESLAPEQRYFEARRMQVYAGMATAMDAEVGRLIAYLEASHQIDNTVFIILSDNGAAVAEPYENRFGRLWLESRYHREVETLGGKGSWVASGRGWGQVSNTPLSGHKFTASEGGTRVPLIVAGALPLTPGLVHTGFTYVIDIVPTLLQLANAGSSPTADGVFSPAGTSLLPRLLERQLAGANATDSTGYEFAGNAALYRGSYKMVRNRPPSGTGHWQLFDLTRDPGETEDLGPSRPGLLQEMQQEYAAYASRVGVLDVPQDYVLQKQAMINALLFVYFPRYLPWFAGIVLLLSGAILYRVRRDQL